MPRVQTIFREGNDSQIKDSKGILHNQHGHIWCSGYNNGYKARQQGKKHVINNCP